MLKRNVIYVHMYAIYNTRGNVRRLSSYKKLTDH